MATEAPLLIQEARQNLTEKRRLQEESEQASESLAQTYSRLISLFDRYRKLIVVEFGSSDMMKLSVNINDWNQQPIKVEISHGSYTTADMFWVQIDALESYLDIRNIFPKENKKILSGHINNNESSKPLKHVNSKDLADYNDVLDRVESELEKRLTS